jgi:hypothetical protein
MMDALPTETPDECYIIEVDGVPKFEFRIFGQALSAALLLRTDFPRCTVKLRSACQINGLKE